MGNKKIVFHTKARDKKTKMNALRVGGFIPGNVYGLSKESEAVYCEANAFKKLYEEVGDTGLIYVKIDDAKEQPVLIDEVSEMSVGNRVLHVAFKRVNLNVAVSADVPIELVGENEVRDTIVTQVKQDVEVEALPQNLPEKFEIDISTLTEVGQTITLADLKFDTSKITLVLGEDVDPESETIVVLQHVAVQEEEETEETAASEEATTEKAAESTEEAKSEEASE